MRLRRALGHSQGRGAGRALGGGPYGQDHGHRDGSACSARLEARSPLEASVTRPRAPRPPHTRAPEPRSGRQEVRRVGVTTTSRRWHSAARKPTQRAERKALTRSGRTAPASPPIGTTARCRSVAPRAGRPAPTGRSSREARPPRCPPHRPPRSRAGFCGCRGEGTSTRRGNVCPERATSAMVAPRLQREGAERRTINNARGRWARPASHERAEALGKGVQRITSRQIRQTWFAPDWRHES